MADGTTILGFPRAPDAPAIRRGARALVDALGMREGLLRVTVTAPHGGREEGALAITPRALPQPPADFILVTSSAVRRVPGPLSRCKTMSRAGEAFALREAVRAGAADAILLNPDGRIVETTARNVFVVEGGIARTPPPSEGALEGITRAAVLELGKDLGIAMEEAPIPPEALLRADEAFVTGSGVGVLGVHRVDDRTFPGAPGPITARLEHAYEQLLDADSRW